MLTGVAMLLNEMVSLTDLQVSLFYIFNSTGILCFIVNIVFEILGFRKIEGSRWIKCPILLLSPIIVIGTISFIGNSFLKILFMYALISDALLYKSKVTALKRILVMDINCLLLFTNYISPLII